MQEHEPDSSISSSKARGKGKSKEEDYGKPGEPEDSEHKIAVIDRQNNVPVLLNEMEELRKKVGQIATMVGEVNEMEELRKKVDQLAKTVAEIGPLPSGRNLAHGRSGVDSARKAFKGETGQPSPSGGSGSRGETRHGRYVGKHQGSHRADAWGTGIVSYIRSHGDGKI